MGKFIISLELVDVLEVGEIENVIEKYRDEDDMGNEIGYDVVEVVTEGEALPRINMCGGLYEPSRVEKDAFVSEWKLIN